MLDALLAEARLRWGLDPSAGVQLVVAERLVATPIEPSRPVLVVPAAVLRAEVPGDVPLRPLAGRHGPGGDDPLAVLRRLYPADHPVGRSGRMELTTVEGLNGDDLARPLYLAPLGLEEAVASPWSMAALSDRLRQPDGCPWDREQTHASLRNHLLEEAYEVYDALAGGATPALAEELGDLLLQVILHAQLAAEAGVFDYTDVNATLARKVVRRHPHVFGQAEARTASDVNRQWERIKAEERAAAAAAAAGADEPEVDPGAARDAAPGGGDPEGIAPAAVSAAAPAAARSALDGISRLLPALAASQEAQARASALGYDWPTVAGIVAKVREELAELLAADGPAAREEEVGDLLMVVVNLARHHGVDAEAALRQANDKFRRRFRVVERRAAERQVALRDLSFEQLDELWDAAKAELAGTDVAPPAVASAPAASTLVPGKREQEAAG